MRVLSYFQAFQDFLDCLLVIHFLFSFSEGREPILHDFKTLKFIKPALWTVLVLFFILAVVGIEPRAFKHAKPLHY